ncbi:uncharacterized protein LOC133299895 [Gastrolobium bilobum]|uniref:uncharacterized protein LOC133299895 n=1 Tax=Gastrolobium bilobum TaxID=150636 RepID=UPI002AB2ABBD|nr:uncharacterized protein LOC133299895 [Gastrolobium bilobum]
MRTQPSDRAATMLLRNNPDSDESIDEDVEELNDVFPNNYNVVSVDATNKQELPLPVRLEFLKGICNQNVAGKGTTLSSSSFEIPLEDEVEVPDFKEGDFGDITGEIVANSSDEDIISQDEGSTVLSARQLHKCGPRFIRNQQVRDTNGNSEALLHSKESASCSASHATCSKSNRSGLWSKAKPRLSHKSGHFGPSISNIDRLPEIMKAVDPKASANLEGNFLENDGRIKINSGTEPDETEDLAHGFNQRSMTDLFDNLQDKSDLYFQHDSQRRGKTVQLFENSRSHLQDTGIDCENSPEPVDSGSSSDNEVTDRNMKNTFPRKKMQTMADRFQEALGTSSVIGEGTLVGALNSLRAGIFGKLQQVLLKEKEIDMDFRKKLQAGARPDSELGCVDVKIISRYLDGKLCVCHCSFGKYTENFLLQDNSKGMRFGGSKSGQSTIIFSQRVCDNVDVEVGNLIRIHPPWKEVQVGNDNIILCTYFSKISFPV